MRHSLAAFILLASFIGFSYAGAAPDPFQPGPFDIAEGEYKLPASVDPEVLPTAKTELWARVFSPRPSRDQRRLQGHPLVVLLHGNHSTCRLSSGTGGSDCTYTREGTCPAGYEVTPNHEGYNYVARHLASHGFVVVSVNANRGITCGFGDGSDWGLNLARGRLVLRHIEQWGRWSRSGNAPESIGMGRDGIMGAIDFSQVGLMGHSRGGEGMRAAYNLFLDSGSAWPARIPGLRVRGIFEIGAVDGQAGRKLDADNVAWNQLLPMCDGDITDQEGRMPFERMLLKTTERYRTPKSMTMAWGMNHNYFNTEWRDNDDRDGCYGHDPVYGPGPTSQAQQNLATGLMSAFFIGHVGADRAPEVAEGVFDPRSRLPARLNSITRVDRDFVPTFDALFNWRFEEFDQPTGTNTHRVPNEASGIKIAHELGVPNRAKIEWTSAGAGQFLQLNWTARGRGRGLPVNSTVDFRIGRREPHMGSKDATDFHVMLVDENESMSAAVPASQFAKILGPASAVELFQTVRIPLAAFGVGAKFKVRGVRFAFNVSGKGAINLSYVRVSAVSVPMGEDLAPILTPIPAEEMPAPQPLVRRPIKESSAEVAKVQMPTNSYSNISKTRSVEIFVRSDSSFPVRDQLPTLVMSGRKFSVSRYHGTGLDTLVFLLTPEEFASLPEHGTMHVQYGRERAVRMWRLPDYAKSQLGR